jgi:hypothetical protein
MWSQKQLDSISARTGLEPPSAFLEAAEAMKLDIPSLFKGGDAADRCDALYFHNAFGENLGDVSLIEIGFLPFWQENNHCETVLIGCRAPFVGCVGAFGILANEEGGLISGNFADFFALLKQHMADHPHKSPLLSELISACAYSGTFRVEVTQCADARIRKHRVEGDGKEYSFYGAMSEELSLELLASDDFLDVEVAARRLGGLRSKKAIPALQRLAAQIAPRGMVDQHFRAAKQALTRIKREAT